MGAILGKGPSPALVTIIKRIGEFTILEQMNSKSTEGITKTRIE